MLEWVKSTALDMRRYRKIKREDRKRLAERKAQAEERKAQARLEAERARLMGLSEKELLVDMMMTLRAYGEDMEDLRTRLRGRLDILERNVEEVAEGMLDLEFSLSCLDAAVVNLEEHQEHT